MNDEYRGLRINQFKNTQGNSWRKELKVIKSGLNVLTFDDTTPNMFALVNPSENDLYIGLSFIPSTTKYEFKIFGQSTGKFGQPNGLNEIYIYNGSSADANIFLFSMAGNFDMSIIDNTNVNINAGDISVGTSLAISGFADNVHLPSGSNTIGKVNVLELDGTKNLGKVEVSALPSTLKNLIGNDTLINLLTAMVNSDDGNVGISEILSALADVKNAIQLISVGGGSGDGGSISGAVSISNMCSLPAGTNVIGTVKTKQLICTNSISDKKAGQTTSVSYDLTTGKYYKINHLTNDGSGDITITYGTVSILVKSGETIADFDIPTNTASISVGMTASADYRLLITEYTPTAI